MILLALFLALQSPEPIKVCVVPESAWAESATRNAVYLWNHNLGQTVFEMTDFCDGARTVTISEARIAPMIGLAFPLSYMEPLAGDILLDSMWLPWSWNFAIGVRILLHEMGHVLGLPHSIEAGSIMWPYVSMENWITEADRQAALLNL